MKKVLLFTSIALLVTAVLAQQVRLKTITILGKGIAVSTSDPADFYIVKIGIARVLAEEEFTIGLLHLDNQSYKLKDIAIGNGTVSAKIYLNVTEVGTLELSAVLKDDTEMWVGPMVLNGKTYNVYAIEGKRPFKLLEIGEKVAEFCKENPEGCKQFVKGIGPSYCEKTPEDPSCREKIRNWCSAHENDVRCVALLRNYCRFHLEDTRCRAQFRYMCKNETENETCRYFQLKLTEIYCEKNPDDKRCVSLQAKRVIDYCIDKPNEEKCLQFRNTFEFMERVRFASYCKSNPTDENCFEFCSVHPIVCQNPPEISNATGVPMEDVLRNVRRETLGRLRIGW